MPKRTDISTILVLGAGPIVIGQACEFDYAGTQACIALKEDGYKVIIVNPNPATVMTDMDYSDVTYIEPLTVSAVTQIIAKEKPCALLPIVGGQTALNLALELEHQGILDQHGVELIGANASSIERAENRKMFHKICEALEIDTPKAITAKSKSQALAAANKIGFPLMVRPFYVLGGLGTGIVHNEQELLCLWDKIPKDLHDTSVLLEESLYGWKEFELEVVRDKNNSCIVVCSIENLDPLGVHTGDSITVAPIQTLTDKEYQQMRLSAFKILEAVEIESGGSNVQFAVNPITGRMVAIEMNPRVSRSSALASKATGFPIAKIATKLAVGYTLDELDTGLLGSQIPASFEPAIDYVVVKIPVFQFEKFPSYEDVLHTQMQSVGEAMAIGRTFIEALLKCMRSLDGNVAKMDFADKNITTPHSKRIWQIFDAFQNGCSIDDIQEQSQIDRWFLKEIETAVEINRSVTLDEDSFRLVKKLGFSDSQIARSLDINEEKIKTYRDHWDIKPVYKRIDGCAAEFPTNIAYLYSTYEKVCESEPSSNKKIAIIGSGANRIGQGIEFDYACVNAIKTLKALKYETIMINCNPETVSTDYNFADRLYCSPLTIEDIAPILEIEKPNGVLLQFGGQEPLNLAEGLEKLNIPLLGLRHNKIDLCEDREKFKCFMEGLQIRYPRGLSVNDEFELPTDLEFPLIIRPSYILGGRSILIVRNLKELHDCVALIKSQKHDCSVLIEQFLEDALEVEVDAIYDGNEIFIPAIMEQLQPAGIHSGDSACHISPQNLSLDIQNELIAIVEKIAKKLNVKGIINVQLAVTRGQIFVLEVNPRCSRTVPFLSKSLNINIIDAAVKCILGFSLPRNLKTKLSNFQYYFVKEPVFSSTRFCEGPLGPEMKSTGEVMGIDRSLEKAWNKAKQAAGVFDGNSHVEVISLQEIFSLN